MHASSTVSVGVVMYKEHPAFEKPQDEDVRIWRYMDFTKFVSLLDRKALFFPRSDKLPDPFEGSYSKPIAEALKGKDQLRKLLSLPYKKLKKFIFINSWHMNEYESAAMWKLYLKSDEGVAIQSTFKRLVKSVDSHAEHDIFIGRVKYIDYETQWFPQNNIFYAFLHKRRSFVHENELRAIVLRFRKKLPTPEEGLDVGLYIDVDLEALIENVFVSPTSPRWFSDLVVSVVKRYELNKNVIQSSLAKGPVY